MPTRGFILSPWLIQALKITMLVRHSFFLQLAFREPDLAQTAICKELNDESVLVDSDSDERYLNFDK